MTMNTKSFERLNDLMGWVTFAIAAWTYWMTVEPSISFWDCPEYVACAVKGEVGHPPGNTFFLLAGRFFANFACGDMTRVAIWINRMSALFSAGTILFLFWTITSLTSRIIIRKEHPTISLAQTITVLGSGLVGSLAYTWSDTFWFSAVEAEVYSFSSLMTALTFWLILKWERRADNPSADRYLILIAYVVGLSIGVHLLNLLCLPAIVLICYFRRSEHPGFLGIMLVLLASFLLIAAILYGFIPGMVWLAKHFELFFVNTLGFGYNSGTLACFVLVFFALIALLFLICRGIVFKGRSRLAYNVVFSLLMLLVGFSTFAQILIRSSAGLPMNENAPDNIFSLSRYLNREQYGSVPLLYGQTFASEVIRDASEGKGKELYAKVVKKDENEPDHYYVYDRASEYAYDYTMLFPRMFSNASQHVAGYKQWSGFTGQRVRVKTADGGTKTKRVPTLGENITFLLRYQLGHMYWRYFFWNFCGRQNDLRGNGEADCGNWITGIPLLDQYLVGSQDNLPRSISENKAYNVFYMLPLLLGLIGLVWQIRRGRAGRQGALVVGMLFFMTGIAIVLYLNQTPFQPRERDYAYAGSFYAFSIWIGMGVAGVSALVHRFLKPAGTSVVLASMSVLACLCVPLQMVGQTWDDHDRSERFTAHDFGQNYLMSLEPNAIIFTSGDNDTFPLWYAIEVEGFRTDVRVCNLEYLQTDWYIDQMKSPAYDSPGLPIPYSRAQYAGNNLLYLPTRDLHLPILTDNILPELSVTLKEKPYLMRNEIMQLSMIDSIARAGWNRPIYFAVSVGSDTYVGLDAYFRTVGLAYQVVPSANGGKEVIDVERTYDCLMNRFKWGNVARPGIYLDETSLNMCTYHRMAFAKVIDALMEQGDTERALQATWRCLEVLPSYNVPHDVSSVSLMRCLQQCGYTKQAEDIARDILTRTDEYLHWAFSLDTDRQRSCIYSIRRQLGTMQYALLGLDDNFGADLFNHYSPKFKQYYEQYSKLGRGQ